MEKRILVIFAHPALQKSKVNIKLAEALGNKDHITLVDLYESYPDFIIDVEQEQARLVSHDVVVLQHPIYWYSSPSIIKEWMDLVLEYGFAYGEGGTALENKVLFNAVTTGGGSLAYQKEGIHEHSLSEFLLPFKQTANLCRMRYAPPFVVYGTHELTEPRDIAVYSDMYSNILDSIASGEFDLESAMRFESLNSYYLDKFESWSV